MQIELDYFFIDSWDSEFGRIFVDGALAWSRSHSFRDSGSSGDICGRPSVYFTDMVEHVVIQVPEHTKNTLTLVVTSTLNDLSTDE